MGWRIVKQPNGRYGRFSDIVDTFTHVNMTEEEALQVCLDEYGMSELEAQRKVQGGVEDWKPFTVGVKGSGHDRWDDALKTIRIYYGEEGIKEVLADIDNA